MKPLALIIMLITIPMLVLAQSGKPYPNYWAVKWVPSSFTTPILPHFRFAIEKRWNHIAINSQAGITVPRRYTIDNTIKGNTQGYACRLEIRRYKKTKAINGRVEFFLGGEAYYYYGHEYQENEFTGDSPAPISGGNYYTDQYTYTKNIWGAVSKWGFVMDVTPEFFIEFSTGLGFKIRNVTEQHRDNLSHVERPNQDFSKWGISPVENQFWVAIPALFAVGYRF